MYVCVISKVCWKYRRPTVVFIIAMYLTKSLVNKMIINFLFVWMSFVWPKSFHFSCWKGVRIIVFIVPDHVGTRARFRWMEVNRCGDPHNLYHVVYFRVILVLMEMTINRVLVIMWLRRKNRAHGKRALASSDMSIMNLYTSQYWTYKCLIIPFIAWKAYLPKTKSF